MPATLSWEGPSTAQLASSFELSSHDHKLKGVLRDVERETGSRKGKRS